MPYIIKKSKFVIMFSFIISLCILSIFSILYYSYEEQGLPTNYVSKNYSSFSMIPNSNKTNLLINSINKHSSHYFLLKNDDSNILGVYDHGESFHPKMIRGKSLTKEDYENKSNVIIIDQSLVSDCIKKGSTSYYIYDSQSYKVIGVFETQHKVANHHNAHAYYNLVSKNILSSEQHNSINRTYFLEAGHYSASIMKKISNKGLLDISQITSGRSIHDRLESVFLSQYNIVSCLLLILLMMFFNSISMIMNWIESRKKEVSIRCYCGATKKQIYTLFIKQYMIIFHITFLLSALCILLSQPFLHLFYIQSFLISYIGILILMLITSFVLYFNLSKRMKGEKL